VLLKKEFWGWGWGWGWAQPQHQPQPQPQPQPHKFILLNKIDISNIEF